jgi:hypothetical protein
MIADLDKEIPMKHLHRPDLYGWSRFDEARNIDFHSVLWTRPGGNVVVDPLPLSPHDRKHLEALGGAAHVIVTNSDHTRDALALSSSLGAVLCGPRAERDGFPLECSRWLGDGDEVAPGFVVHELKGSKTPGELALVLDETTLVTGDLVRGHVGGRLNLLPDSKLANRTEAIASLARIVDMHPRIDAVLVGDGWPLFRGGASALRDLLRS